MTTGNNESLVAADFVEVGGAFGEFGFGAVVDGVHGLFFGFVAIAPERSGAVDAVFVARVEIDVEGAEFFLVVLVMARDAGGGFEGGGLRRFSLAHHLDNLVAAGSLVVF